METHGKGTETRRPLEHKAKAVSWARRPWEHKAKAVPEVETHGKSTVTHLDLPELGDVQHTIVRGGLRLRLGGCHFGGRRRWHPGRPGCALD